MLQKRRAIVAFVVSQKGKASYTAYIVGDNAWLELIFKQIQAFGVEQLRIFVKKRHKGVFAG